MTNDKVIGYMMLLLYGGIISRVRLVQLK